MRKPRDTTKFDMKETIDLIRGFNASVMRITEMPTKEERKKEINGLGKRLVMLGRKISKVKTADL